MIWRLDFPTDQRAPRQGAEGHHAPSEDDCPGLVALLSRLRAPFRLGQLTQRGPDRADSVLADAHETGLARLDGALAHWQSVGRTTDNSWLRAFARRNARELRAEIAVRTRQERLGIAAVPQPAHESNSPDAKERLTAVAVAMVVAIGALYYLSLDPIETPQTMRYVAEAELR